MLIFVLIILLYFNYNVYGITFPDGELSEKSGVIAIYFNTQPGMGYPTKPQCTGSKISEVLILTAAHCVYKYNPEQIYISDGKIINDGVNLIPIKDIIINSEYIKNIDRAESGLHDIALLRTGIKMSKNGIFLLENDKIDTLIARSKLSIYGYGLDEKGEYRNKLMYANASNLSEQVANSRLNYSYDLNKLIPVGGYKENIRKFSGPCNGDSGGPLLFKHEKKEYLIGIASYGVVKENDSNIGYVCEGEYASTYVRIKGSINWIKKAASILEKKKTYNHYYKILDQREDTLGNFDILNLYIINNEKTIEFISEFNITISDKIIINNLIYDELGEKILYKFNNKDKNIYSASNKIICKYDIKIDNNLIYSKFNKDCLPNRFSLLVVIKENQKNNIDEIFASRISLSK